MKYSVVELNLTKIWVFGLVQKSNPKFMMFKPNQTLHFNLGKTLKYLIFKFKQYNLLLTDKLPIFTPQSNNI